MANELGQNCEAIKLLPVFKQKFPDWRLWRRFVLPPEIRNADALTRALVTISKRWPAEIVYPDKDISPVFILSAGWGSGSTLLQRLVMSSGKIVVWGEPLDQAAVIHRMGMSVACIRSDWPPDYHFRQSAGLSELTGQWVANLVPSISNLHKGQRKMMEEWLGGSAAQFGASRWGYKEVRLTIDHARYIKWLFPKAKIIFLYRDLFKCYQSCKGVNWYSVWPGYPMKYPVVFARHWKKLVSGFVKGHEELGAMLIRYEDLVTGNIRLSDIAEYVEIDLLDEALMERPVGARGHKNKQLSVYERMVLKAVGGSVLSDLGYPN